MREAVPAPPKSELSTGIKMRSASTLAKRRGISFCRDVLYQSNSTCQTAATTCLCNPPNNRSAEPTGPTKASGRRRESKEYNLTSFQHSVHARWAQTNETGKSVGERTQRDSFEDERRRSSNLNDGDRNSKGRTTERWFTSVRQSRKCICLVFVIDIASNVRMALTMSTISSSLVLQHWQIGKELIDVCLWSPRLVALNHVVADFTS